MSINLRRLLILLLGALLIVAPLAIRITMNRWGPRAYKPPAIDLADLAVTPIPTPTAIPAPRDIAAPADELSLGPVWVDLAHFPFLDPSQFESLADALAAQGVGLRFWVSDVDVSQIENSASFPDQSETLAPLLEDASGLVVVSPSFLWTPAEIALVEEFVADGGRLLLISDPDVWGDAPWNINSLGEPFGVVFNDDYLYDQRKNDGNFTHFFQGEFLDRAAGLSGSTVAFYGARSISGPVISQARSADTTLSSLRTGFTRFTTVAVGGLETNGTAGNVLAVGDFDVLAEPFVTRHDNHLMLGFVADFLAGAQREQTLPDFPGYLGQQVALVFGGDVLVDAELLQQGGALQERLKETGRVLMLSSSTTLSPIIDVAGTLVPTSTQAISTTPSPSTSGSVELEDLIYLGTFQSAGEETKLLADAGIRTVWELETSGITETLVATQTSTAVIDEPTQENSAGQSVPPVTPTPEPEGTLVLEMDSGLRFLAAEVVLVLQQEQGDGTRVIAVLGSDSQAISAGLNRLRYHLFDDCVNRSDMSVCPFFREDSANGGPTDGEPVTSAPRRGEAAAPAPDAAGVAILVVDDNDLAAPDEASEAVLILQALADVGYVPDRWSTADQGSLSEADVAGYDWVIWSGGLYEVAGPDFDEQGILWDFALGGGKLTISGRNHPLVGESPKEASVIADVVKTDEVQELVVGFPDEPIELPPGLPPVVPMAIQLDDGGPSGFVVLRRGPQSADAGSPLMVAITGTGEPDPAEVRALLVGMPITWLPADYGPQLVQNMAAWILAQ